MTELEKLKIDAELHAVIAARKGLEVKRAESLENVKRIDASIQLQLEKEKELSEKLNLNKD